MNTAASRIFRTMLVPAALGLLAGVAGGLFGFSYYLSSQVEPPAAPNRPVFSVTAPLPEVEIAARLSRLDLPLFKKSAIEGDPADQALLEEQAIGAAAALTSDGWLMTHQSVLKNGPIVVGVGGRLLEPTAVIQDAGTGVVFLKVAAAALQVSGFEETDRLAPGASLYAEDADRLFARTSFSGLTLSDRKGRPKALLSADQFSRVYRLDRPFGAKSVGGAVVTSSGNLAGIIAPAADGQPSAFIPIHLLRSVLSAAFRGQAISRAGLGLNYLSPTTALGEPPARGLLVAGSKKWGLPAVTSGGPAAAAGLADGDLLVRIDDTDLTGARELSEILAEYPHGAKVVIEAQRAGERKTFEVVLR